MRMVYNAVDIPRGFDLYPGQKRSYCRETLLSQRFFYYSALMIVHAL